MRQKQTSAELRRSVDSPQIGRRLLEGGDKRLIPDPVKGGVMEEALPRVSVAPVAVSRYPSRHGGGVPPPQGEQINPYTNMDLTVISTISTASAALIRLKLSTLCSGGPQVTVFGGNPL